MRYLMTFSYDGSNFYGYQTQNSKRTIQNEIEKQLTKINGNNKVHIYASGRTDRGVHAYNQKAHFDMPLVNVEKIKNSLNKLLPEDIYIKYIESVSNDFHARFNVVKKEYIYKINLGKYDPLMRNYIYQLNEPLNVELLKEATTYLVGEHNFKSFTKTAENDLEDYIRTIYDIEINLNQNILEIKFIGSGFMRYMIRNMVGTLLEVGKAKIEPKKVLEILNSKDRTKALKTAPACGLYLNQVYY